MGAEQVKGKKSTMAFRSESLSDMMKDGTKHLSGLMEAVSRNIEACKKLAQITRTSLGPNGRNKIIINHVGKIFVTNDSTTILHELDVIHPAAKMIVLASEMQEKEIGDGANLVIILAGELLQQAEALIRMGLHPSEVVAGYTKAGLRAQELLSECVLKTSSDLKDVDAVTKFLRPVIGSKQYGYEDLLAPIVAKACVQILPDNPKNFNVDNVRVIKVVGASVSQTTVVKGFAFARDVEGTYKKKESAKLAVFVSGVDFVNPEAKRKVVMDTADEL